MGDRISDLPDSVLCHILSFLPTKVAVSTSVLSKRWQPLWRSVPAFDFILSLTYGDKNKNKRDVISQYFNSINAFLNSRDPLQCLRIFCLICHCDRFSKRISYPINYFIKLVSDAAVQHRLEHLEVILLCRFGLPSVVLSCKTLVVLKLGYLVLKDFSSVDLPSLKTMHLHIVSFPEYRFFEYLLSGCPNIEDLEITGTLRFDNYAAEPKLKKLTKLVRAVVRKDHIPFEVVSHVQFLRIEWMDKKVEIGTEDFPQFHNLTHIEFRFVGMTRNWPEIFKVLEHCPKLEHLVMDQWCLEDEYHLMSDWQYPQRVPTCMLSHLKTCRMVNYGDYQPEIEFARYIMQNARVLQNMSILTFTQSIRRILEIRKRLSLFSSSCKLSVQRNKA